MNEFHVRLNILIEILLKKKDALTIIQNICENEETILASGGSHPELLAAMSEEKQKAIVAVLDADELFQSSYNAIRGEFELKAPQFRDDAKRLQELISLVCEQDMRIRVQEEKNKRLGRSRNKPAAPTRNSAKVAQSYTKTASGD